MFAGYNGQSPNTNIINATGEPLNGDLGTDRTFIAPIRESDNKILTYDPSTKEVTYVDVDSGSLSTTAKVSLQTVTDGTNPNVIGQSPFNSTNVTSHFTAGLTAVTTLPPLPIEDAITVGGRIGLNNGITSTVFGTGDAPSSTNPLSGTGRVAIGYGAGESPQGQNATAVGFQAGQNSQSEFGVALGFRSGQNSQKSNSIAIGTVSGINNQGSNAIAIGTGSGQTSDNDTIAIGTNAGQSSQSNTSIAIGTGAASNSQKANAIAIGTNTANTDQGKESIAIGVDAMSIGSGDTCVAIGKDAGRDYLATDSIAIGNEAGRDHNAGNTESYRVCIGTRAGYRNQGQDSIAIGRLAGDTNQSPNSIVLNATGISLSTTTSTSSGLYIKPIRNATNPYVLTYDDTSGEIVYSSSSSPVTEYTTVIHNNVISTNQVSLNAYVELPHNLGLNTFADKKRLMFKAFSLSDPSPTITVQSLLTAGVAVQTVTNSIIISGPLSTTNSYSTFTSTLYSSKTAMQDCTHLFEQNYMDANRIGIRYVSKYSENVSLVGSGSAVGNGPVESVDFSGSSVTYHQPVTSSSWFAKSTGTSEYFMFVLYKV
jgi:hypothetical protein